LLARYRSTVDMRLARALPAAKIPASSCNCYLFPSPKAALGGAAAGRRWSGGQGTRLRTSPKKAKRGAAEGCRVVRPGKAAVFHRRMRKTARPVVWEGWRAKSRHLDPIGTWATRHHVVCGDFWRGFRLAGTLSESIKSRVLEPSLVLMGLFLLKRLAGMGTIVDWAADRFFKIGLPMSHVLGYLDPGRKEEA